MLRVSPALSLLMAAFQILLFSNVLAQPHEKLDAVLQTAIRHAPTEQWLGRIAGDRNNGRSVSVLAKVDDGGQEIRRFLAQGKGRVTSTHGEILVLDILPASLSDMASLPSVQYVEASHYFRAKLDRVAQFEGVNSAALQIEHSRATGRGVVIGILDTGTDTENPAFRDTDGTTRLLYYWDQTVKAVDRYPSITDSEGAIQVFEIGAEYTAEDIQEGRFVGRDSDGHGTHVAGIAAGRDAEFPGIAPESSIITVVNDGNQGYDIFELTGSGPTLDAYRYFVSRRDELNLPLVVNQSQGTLMGPHDGSSLFEQALQYHIEENNLLICISSGNEQQEQKHALDQLPPSGQAEVEVKFEQGDPEENRFLVNSLELWFSPGPRPTLSMELYADDEYTSLVGMVGPLSFTQTGLFPFPNSARSVIVEKELPSKLNGDNRFLLTFNGPESEEVYLRLVLDNQTGRSSPVNLYLQQGTESIFRSDVGTPRGTLGVPATTPGAITVGAYTTRTEWQNVAGNLSVALGSVLHQLAPFSSIGPPRNLALYQGVNSVKPDLCAPGDAIISQRSGDCDEDDCPDFETFEDGRHLVLSGTSMSTPVVSGVVALMLQDNPVATPEQIKTWLFEGCRSDFFTGETPNDNWGHGKLDALRAFQAVVSPQPVLHQVTPLESDFEGHRRFKLSGENIALTHRLLLDGVELESESVEWLNHREIVFQVPTDNHFASITVLNLKAPPGSQSAQIMVASDQNQPAFVADSSGGFCFVATAAFGSPLEPRVAELRVFRDECLLSNTPGRAFVSLYYQASPPLARFISQHEEARAVARVVLIPVAWAVSHRSGLLLLGFIFGMLIFWNRSHIFRRRSATKRLPS